jgi:hypothetical protein
MSKYYVDKIEKIEQSFTQRINSINETTGAVQEPFKFHLIKKSFFGLISTKVCKTFHFDSANFNPIEKLKKGREITLPTNAKK